jgi:hypothetical protein
MNLFRSEEQVPGGGAVIPVAQLAELAVAWYGGRLAPDWRPRTRDQSQAILDRCGLTGEFWKLPA